MNFLTARNAALLLILYLLWFVLSGIYKNHTQQALMREQKEFQQQEITRIQHARHSAITSSTTSAAKTESRSNKRSLTADDIRTISTTGRLPSWAKNADKKRLSLDEIEEIISSGKLPEQ
jgi:hypothetical protein